MLLPTPPDGLFDFVGVIIAFFLIFPFFYAINKSFRARYISGINKYFENTAYETLSLLILENEAKFVTYEKYVINVTEVLNKYFKTQLKLGLIPNSLVIYSLSMFFILITYMWSLVSGIHLDAFISVPSFIHDYYLIFFDLSIENNGNLFLLPITILSATIGLLTSLTMIYIMQSKMLIIFHEIAKSINDDNLLISAFIKGILITITIIATLLTIVLFSVLLSTFVYFNLITPLSFIVGLVFIYMTIGMSYLLHKLYIYLLLWILLKISHLKNDCT